MRNSQKTMRMTEIFRTLNLLLKFIAVTVGYEQKKMYKLANYLHYSHYYSERARFSPNGKYWNSFTFLISVISGFRIWFSVFSIPFYATPQSLPLSMHAPWNKISFIVVQQSENWNISNKMKLLRRKFDNDWHGIDMFSRDTADPFSFRWPHSTSWMFTSRYQIGNFMIREINFCYEKFLYSIFYQEVVSNQTHHPIDFNFIFFMENVTKKNNHKFSRKILIVKTD